MADWRTRGYNENRPVDRYFRKAEGDERMDRMKKEYERSRGDYDLNDEPDENYGPFDQPEEQRD